MKNLKLITRCLYLLVLIPTICSSAVLREYSVSTLGFSGEKISGYGNKASGIVVDKHGALWIVTESGNSVYKFDGSTTPCTKFSIPGASVNDSWDNSICTTPDGKIWIATSGVYKFDGISSWEKIDNSSSGFPTYGVGRIQSHNSSGDIWGIKTHEYIAKYDGSSWTKYEPDSSLNIRYLNGFAIDQATGVIWCSSYSGLLKFENDTWTLIDMISGTDDETIESVGMGFSDRVWMFPMFTTTAYAVNYDGDNLNEFDSISTKGMQLQGALCKADTKNNLMYFFSKGLGLVKYDGTDFSLCSLTDTLPEIRNLAFGDNGDIWLTSRSMLYYYNEKDVGIDGKMHNTFEQHKTFDFHQSGMNTYTVGLNMPNRSDVTIKITDLSGRTIKSIFSGQTKNKSAKIDFSLNVANGTYLCTVKSVNGTSSKMFSVLK